MIIVGRVVLREFKEPDQIHYLVSDSTGSITVIDYEGGSPDFAGHRNYRFEYSSEFHWTRCRWFGYIKVCGVLLVRKDKYQIALEVINNITDYNEKTNHMLRVIVARCARKYGTPDPKVGETKTSATA